MPRNARVLALALALTGTSCVLIFQEGEIREIPVDSPATTTVESPMKAFLLDGSITVYEAGATVSPEAIVGPGVRYSLGLTDTARVSELPLDSVVGIEAFQGRVHAGKSALVSVLTTGAVTIGTVALLKALFGSCPTIYVDTDEGPVLQAEAFSYSIAPLLEARDVDRLEVKPDDDGFIRLELRNEALETHYINHLELLAVEHDADVRVVPDERGLPIGVTDPVPPARALDRDGRSVLPELTQRDRLAFATTDARISAASTIDSRDFIELAFPSVPDADTVVAVLELRNSLLNTVLFYDLMLGSAGAGALDWLGRSMDRIDGAVELGRWFHETMGLSVEVFDGERWLETARVGDSGPIAWKELGVRIPVLEPDSIRLRLGFLADEWRIDRVEIGRPEGLGRSSRIPVSRIVDLQGQVHEEAVGRLALPDEEYLVAYPGSAARLEFPAPETADGVELTFLLSTQGYYTEWVRPQWIASAEETTPFKPGEGTVEALMARWLEEKEGYEEAFFDSRIPVR